MSKKYNIDTMRKKLDIDSRLFLAFENTILDTLTEFTEAEKFKKFYKTIVENFISSVVTVYEECDIAPQTYKKVMLYENKNEADTTKQCREVFNKYIEENVINKLYKSKVPEKYTDVIIESIEEGLDKNTVAAYVCYEDAVKQFLFEVAFPRYTFKEIVEYQVQNNIIQDEVASSLLTITECINILGPTIASIVFDKSTKDLNKDFNISAVTGITNTLTENNVPSILEENWKKYTDKLTIYGVEDSEKKF